jgi:hypothetical protein
MHEGGKLLESRRITQKLISYDQNDSIDEIEAYLVWNEDYGDFQTWKQMKHEKRIR